MPVMQFDPLSQIDRMFRGLLPDGGGRSGGRMPIPMDSTSEATSTSSSSTFPASLPRTST